MFLLVDKPSGYTSYALVEKVKRLYAGEKVGHGGTLDPLATGLLVIALGKDTKQLSHFLGAKKTYRARIDLAAYSDTRDSDYRKEYTKLSIVEDKIQIHDQRKPFPERSTVISLLDTMLHTNLFPLTPFSAKKINGKKLYEYARAGTPIFLDVPMRVFGYTLLEYAFPFLEIEVEVGSGTYIRSLAHRLGNQLGVGGMLTSLRRTKVGTLQVPTNV